MDAKTIIISNRDLVMNVLKIVIDLQKQSFL